MEMSLCSNAKIEQVTRQNQKEDKDQEVSLSPIDHPLLVPLNPVISAATKVLLDAKAQNKSESVATNEQKSSKVPTDLNKTCRTVLGNAKMESAKLDNSDFSAVTALETNLMKSAASSILSQMTAGIKEKQRCISNESSVQPHQWLSLESNAAAEAELSFTKELEDIEKETMKSKLISPRGSSTLQENEQNEQLQKIAKNQLKSSKIKHEADFHESDCGLTDSIAANVSRVLQRFDNDLGDSTKPISILANKQMDSSKLTNHNISTKNDTKQQERHQVETINSTTQPLDKPLIQTEIKKGCNRMNSVVSYVCKQDGNSYPTESPINPCTEEVVKVSKPAVKRKISRKSSFATRKRRRRKICSTKCLALEPMNNKPPMEDITLEKRIDIVNSEKKLLQKTVYLNIDKNVHPMTGTVSESVSATQKILSVQKGVCSAETESVSKDTSLYKPVTLTINSKNSTDNTDTRTLKVMSLSENLSALNLIDVTDDSNPLSKSTQVNLIKVKQTIAANNSKESAPPLLIYSNSKQPLYTLELLDRCENSVVPSSQQLNSPMQCATTAATNCQLISATGIQTLYKPILNGCNLYSIPYKPENLSLPIKAGIRYTMMRCNANQVRPGEIKIAPKTSNETAVSGNNTSLQYIKLLNSGPNTQPVNNVNVCPNNPTKIMSNFTPLNSISSLTPPSSNRLPCPPLQPLGDQTKAKIPLIRPVPKYPDIKIVDVRTDSVNKNIPRSAREIVPIKSPEIKSADTPQKSNASVQMQASEIKITSTPKITANVQTPFSKITTMYHDSNSSQVNCKDTDVRSPSVELIEQEPRMFQVEVQVPQTMSETTKQQQKPNASLSEQKNVTSTAARDLSNLIIARETVKQNKVTSEKRKLMLLEKEAMHKRQIDMLQHVFKVLNQCARMCAVEDFEIWFKKGEPPSAQSDDANENKEKQKSSHVMTEKPGEWVGLLKVLKVNPTHDENQIPKRRRSSKTVAQAKSKQKSPEVVVKNGAQKRKSNEYKNTTLVELPVKSPKIRKYKQANSVTRKKNSSCIIDPKESSENLESPATTEQEVDLTTYQDKKENENELTQSRKRLETDKSNDARCDVNVEFEKRKPGRPKKSDIQKKYVTPRIHRTRGNPRAWINQSPDKGESKLIISNNVIVKSESTEVKPNTSNYNARNDNKYCQDFRIRECYVRLRRIEELYPSGYSSIDFDSIFS